MAHSPSRVPVAVGMARGTRAESGEFVVRVATGRRGMFIVWRAYQGRVDAMQAVFDYRPHYLGHSYAHRLLRPVEYLQKSWATWRLLRAHRPQQVWLQLPPTVVLYLLAAYKRRHPHVRVVADCHNILLERPWSRTPRLRALLRDTADVVLFHNERVYRRAVDAGLAGANSHVLETRPAVTESDGGRHAPGYPRPWVLFPASFKADEPIDVLFEVARATPRVTYVVTGDSRRAQADLLAAAPANVTFTGWVDRPTYKGLVAGADVVLGLTLLDDVQLSVANEAVGFGKAMVLSDTPLLRHLFPEGAVYARAEAGALQAAVEAALASRTRLEEASRRLRGERLERWAAQASRVAGRLAGPGGEP